MFTVFRSFSLIIAALGSQEMAAENGTVVALILDKTPFYAEQGGQLGDEGFLEFNGHHFKVRDTQKSGSYVLHLGTLFGGGALKVISKRSQSAARRVGRRFCCSAREFELRKHLLPHLSGE